MVRIVSLTDRIGAITEALRGFARRGKEPLAPVPIGTIIEGALTLLEGPLRQAGVTPLVTVPPEPVHVIARPIELEQVFVNLLRNAIEALMEGGQGGEPALAITVTPGDERVEIAITDRGPGLSEQALARIGPDYAGIVVTDIRMPGMDGIELFRRLRAPEPDLPGIMLSGHADIALSLIPI